MKRRNSDRNRNERNGDFQNATCRRMEERYSPLLPILQIVKVEMGLESSSSIPPGEVLQGLVPLHDPWSITSGFPILFPPFLQKSMPINDWHCLIKEINEYCKEKGSNTIVQGAAFSWLPNALTLGTAASIQHYRMSHQLKELHRYVERLNQRDVIKKNHLVLRFVMPSRSLSFHFVPAAQISSLATTASFT
eukprot:CFRG1606T1